MEGSTNVQDNVWNKIVECNSQTLKCISVILKCPLTVLPFELQPRTLKENSTQHQTYWTILCGDRPTPLPVAYSYCKSVLNFWGN